MSSPHLLETSRAMRPDASQGADALPSAPFDNAQKMVYPSLYPLPGSSHPPLVSPPNATLPTSPPLAPSMYGAGVAHSTANYQGYYSQAGFMPPMENPALPMNYTDLHTTCYPLVDMPVGNAISPTAPLTSEDTSHDAQFVWSSTFQAALPTQPEADPDLRQARQVQPHRQAPQEDLAVAEPSWEPGNVPIEIYQTDQESRTAPVAPGVSLCGDQLANHSHSPKTNKAIHTCLNEPHSACSRGEVICLNILAEFVYKHPDVLSLEKIAEYAIEAIAPLGSNGGQSTDLFSLLDIADPAPSQPGQICREMASPGSSTTTSTSTSGRSSPSGSFVHPPSCSPAASSSTSSISRSAAKRKRSEDHLEDSSSEQQQEEYTGVGGLEHDRNSCTGNNQTFDSSENPRKKRKSSDNREYICRICSILGRPCPLLSRRDSLKRHILSLHEIFSILFGHETFDLLKPRQKGQSEDLGPLIVMCISLQLEAQRRGAEIKPGHDLAAVYPQIAASLNYP